MNQPEGDKGDAGREMTVEIRFVPARLEDLTGD
jgi:hypothetical protein